MRMRKKASASSGIRPQRGCRREDIMFDRLLQVCGCEEEYTNLSSKIERSLVFQEGYALCSSKLSLDAVVDYLSKLDKQSCSALLHMLDQDFTERIMHRVCHIIPESNRFSEGTDTTQDSSEPLVILQSNMSLSKCDDRNQATPDSSEHSNFKPQSQSSTRNRDLLLSRDFCNEEESAEIRSTEDQIEQKTSSPENSLQPTIVIGLVGHMKHGKTTLKNSLCGIQVAPGTTEEIGFDNAKVYKCEDECCTSSTRYIMHGCRDRDYGFHGHEKCKVKLMMHLSFVDCPGHPNYLPTTLSAVGIMDDVILVISADESCGQPQTTEHLIALEIKHIKDIIIVQSKVDSVSTRKKLNHLREIKDYIKDTVAKDAVILEKAESYIDMVCKTIVEDIPKPIRSPSKAPLMIIVKSNDENSDYRNSNSNRRLVVHGVLLQGMLTPNHHMQITPGIVFKEDGILKHSPLIVQTVSIYAEETQLQFALPGGIIKLYLTTASAEPVVSLAGHYLGEEGNLPSVFTAFKVNYSLLQCILGLRKGVAKELRKNEERLNKEEMLLVTTGALSTGARVLSASRKTAELLLTFPVCARKGETVTFCRRVGLSWRLAGKACLIAGVTRQRLSSSTKTVES